VNPKGQTRDPQKAFEFNISKTVGDKRLHSTGPPIGNGLWGITRESNGYVTDDVTSHVNQQGQVMTCMDPSMSKTIGDVDLF